MEQDNNLKRNPSNNKILIGLLLIAGGVLLFINKTDSTILPDWLFTWPSLIILIGVIVGIQHNFRNFFWIALVGWGVYSLLDVQMPELHLKNYTAPIALIFVGLFFMFRRNHTFKKSWNKDRWNKKWNDFDVEAKEKNLAQTEEGEYLDITMIFSGSKKVVLSKNFRGGDITCFMGGAEIDLMQADIQSRAVIDGTCVFGAIKLIVPSNWEVKLENTAAFGSVEDKRRAKNFSGDSPKQLIITGTAVFGGIEITNY